MDCEVIDAVSFWESICSCSISSSFVCVMDLSSVILLVRIPGGPGCGCSDDWFDIEPDREEDAEDVVGSGIASSSGWSSFVNVSSVTDWFVS